jgi:hypothetical protein
MNPIWSWHDSSHLWTAFIIAPLEVQQEISVPAQQVAQIYFSW